ncbi:MAG: hypothetical protein ACFE8L_11225 [Candidatus Hodarchaeota archaeon]
MMKRKSKIFTLLLSLSFISLTFLSRNVPFVQSWKTTATGVCTASEDQNTPRLISTSDGGTIIAWNDGRNLADYDIYAQKLDAYGNVQWTVDGVTVCTFSGHQSSPQLCSDGAGGAIIVWRDYRKITDPDLYAQRIDSSGAIVWDSNGVIICNATSSQSNFDVCSDEVGGAIVVWQDDRPSFNLFDIYAQRINQDGMTLWGDNGTVVCDANDDQQFPKLICTTTGRIYFTWQDARAGASDLNIYAQQFNLTGHPQWPANGWGVCTYSSDQSFPNIVSDGAGSAIVTWLDYRFDPLSDIFANKINPTGAIEWGAGGAPICTMNDSQINAQICSDMNNGAIIVWEDRRSTLDHDLYAQRINGTGDIQWTPNGTAICTAEYEQQGPVIISDGDSGAIIVWTDHRSNLYWNLYVQRVLPNGTNIWGINGMAVDPVPNEDQFGQDLVLFSTGATIITWDDPRTLGDRDIWAQYHLDVEPPTSNNPSSIIYEQGTTALIPWVLSDNAGGGYYRVKKNESEHIPWTEWSIGEDLAVPIDTSLVGVWHYTIEYNDSRGLMGIPDTVIITITERPSRETISGYSFLLISISILGIIIIIKIKMTEGRKK